MWACVRGTDRRIIEILIEEGGQVGAKDNWGHTALHLAVLRRRLQAVELLLSRGSNVNEKDIYGSTPLHLAANSSPEWTDGVKAIMNQSAVEVNPRDGRGQTPLHVACSRRSLHTVELLLGHNGIDANVVDNDGDTPMHEAVRGQRYNIVSKMLIQGSLQLDIKNKKERTPLLEAVSRGHLGMTHKLIALGADINAVDGEGNSCLHLAVNRNVFDSEDAPLDLLNECCTSLNLKIEERLSGIVVARYLASQGADFHHKNNKNNTPLDLIKDPNLRKKLETFLPPQCLLCRNKTATTKVHPCEHLLTCEECSNVPLKRCLRCLKPVTSRGRVASPKFADKGVQTDLQLLEPTSEQSESRNLNGKYLKRAAEKLGGNWQQAGIFLGVPAIDQDIIKNDFPHDTVKQSYQMLCEWFINCKPEERTVETLRRGLKDAECFAALEYLSLYER